MLALGNGEARPPPAGDQAAPKREAPRARTPAPDEDDIRERVLAATGQLLVDQRFDEISVADILDAAAISRGAFISISTANTTCWQSWFDGPSAEGTRQLSPGSVIKVHTSVSPQ